MLRIEQRVRRLTVNALDRASNAVNLRYFRKARALEVYLH